MIVEQLLGFLISLSRETILAVSIIQFQLSDDHTHVCLQIAKLGIFVINEEVVSDCLWVLSYITDTDQDYWLDRVAQGDVLHVLCQSLLSDNISLYVPAVKTLGSILTSNDPMVIDRCLWSSFLDHLSVLLKNLIQDQTRNDTLRESCWALSNMTASANSLDKFIESPCFGLIMDISMNSSLKRDTRKEAIWVLCNSITGSSVELQVKMLQISDLRLVPIIIDSFRLDPENRLSENLLESLDELLKLDQLQGWKETDRSIAYLVERTGGLDVLETVQRSPNYKIYKMAADITSKYFEVDTMQVTSSAQQQQRPSSGGVQGTNQPMFNI